MILGFDPRYQFVHEDDVVNALKHVVLHELPGVYNVAADGVLALSEVAGLLGKPYAPILPPWGTGLALAALRPLGLRIPPEMQNQLRFGRGVDNRLLKSTGFEYAYTSREAVLKLGEHLRLHPLLRSGAEPYRYEQEVEEFLRWSPNVRGSSAKQSPFSQDQLVELQRLLSETAKAVERPAPKAAPKPAPAPPTPRRPAAPVEHYDDLESEEVISLLGSLERNDLLKLLDYERDHAARGSVIHAIESVLTRAEAAARTH
jgi:UDP-glucose 4-epimerase